MSYHLAFPGFNVIRYFRNRELTELYISMFIKSLARSLVLVFIPIYLISLGFSIRFIALFYLLEFVGMTIATPLGLWLNHKVGVKKTMVISDVLFILYMIAVSALKIDSVLFVLPILLFAFSSGLFWAAYDVDFTQHVDRKYEGQELSVIKAILLVAAALGPLLGSIVIVNSSFVASFITAAVLSLLSAIPLFWSADYYEPKPKFSWKRLQQADQPAKALSYASYGTLQSATETFWPLFMFLALSSVLEIGTVFTLTTIIMVGVILWHGRRVDRKPIESLVGGVLLNAPSWLIRLLLVSPLGFFLSNLYGQLSYHMLDTAYEKVVYTEARDSADRSNYFFFRQIWIGVGRLVVCLAVLLTGRLEAAFMLTFVATFGYLVLVPRLRSWGHAKRTAHM